MRTWVLGVIIWAISFSIIFPVLIAFGEVETPDEFDQCFQYDTISNTYINCQLIIPKDFNVSAWQDLGDDELAQEVLDEIEWEKDQGFYTRPPLQKPDVPEDDGDEQTTADVIKQILCDRKNKKPSLVELCRLLGNLDMCEQGVRETESEPIQTRRSFLISNEFPADKAWDLRQSNVYLVKILKAIEECNAQWKILQPLVLGPRYLDFVRQDIDIQPYHAERSTADREYQGQRLTQYSFDRSIVKAYQAICLSDVYPNQFKVQQGCNITYTLDDPSYYAYNFPVNPTYGVPIKDEGGAYADFQKYRSDEAGYIAEWGLRKYVTIYEIYTSSDDINLTLSVKERR